MLVVIIVVVWIRVLIGVGFFIVLGSYVWSGICVDFVMVLLSSLSVIRFVIVLLLGDVVKMLV